MFRFHKTLDIVTLFHKSSSPASVRVANVLKQASAEAQSGATEDQASDHSVQRTQREAFELNITEELPTPDQVNTILQYVGPSQISTVVKGARDAKEALEKFKQSTDNLQRPITVDWNNGRALAGDNQSEILNLLNAKKSE